MRNRRQVRKVQDLVFAITIAGDHGARQLAINPFAPETTFESLISSLLRLVPQ